MKKIILCIMGLWGIYSPAQHIEMNFPHFKGKSYDFVLFQGTNAITVMQDTIPESGKFILSIPKDYAPYTGMSRWLITGTQEGGGLDMIIPGHNFSVSCLEAKPSDENIIYTNNTAIPELITLSKKQQAILSRYEVMLQATRVFKLTDKNYPIFKKEEHNQLQAYQSLQAELKKYNDYPSKFINIVNITRGTGTMLFEKEEEKAQHMASYIAEDLDWEALYTSGHWVMVIFSWIDIHTQVLKDEKSFVKDFDTIGSRIKNPDYYRDFAGRIATVLTQQGRDDLIDVIAPKVVASGKITQYEGSLSVYKRGVLGSLSPDIIVNREGEKEPVIMKSSEFSGKDHEKTVLFFYKTECGACENMLSELSASYEQLKTSKVRVISISADKDTTSFGNKAKTFPWNDAFCDFEGIKGVNFRNYGVTATPTLLVVDRDGKLLKRGASLKEVLAL